MSVTADLKTLDFFGFIRTLYYNPTPPKYSEKTKRNLTVPNLADFSTQITSFGRALLNIDWHHRGEWIYCLHWVPEKRIKRVHQITGIVVGVLVVISISMSCAWIESAMNQDTFAHGESVAELPQSIADGFPARGMLGWSATMAEGHIRSLAILIAERHVNLTDITQGSRQRRT